MYNSTPLAIKPVDFCCRSVVAFWKKFHHLYLGMYWLPVRPGWAFYDKGEGLKALMRKMVLRGICWPEP